MKLEPDGTAMVAFKTHNDASGGMTKKGQKLKGNVIELTLISENELQPGGWGSL